MGKSITDLSSVTTIGLDLAKHVFQVHGVDASGRVVVAKAIPSGQPGPAAMLTPANRGILPANLKGDERRTGGANYDLPFARKPQFHSLSSRKRAMVMTCSRALRCLQE